MTCRRLGTSTAVPSFTDVSRAVKREPDPDVLVEPGGVEEPHAVVADVLGEASELDRVRARREANGEGGERGHGCAA